MYHSISEDPEPGVHPYYRVCTSPQRFAEQMHWLKDNGYRGVSVSQGLEWLREQAQCGGGSENRVDGQSRIEDGRLKMESGASGGGPADDSSEQSGGNTDGSPEPQASALHPLSSALRPVALTFDDGFRDFASSAAPILATLGFTATVYLITEAVGRQFKNRPCLDWNEIRQLRSAGFEFGSHTVTHPKLWELTQPELDTELRESAGTIEQQLQQPVHDFAHPYAFPRTNRAYVTRFTETAATCGYRSAVTTSLGCVKSTDNLLALNRLPVNDGDEPDLFRAKIQGHYDWLARPQAAIKRLKSLAGR